MKKTKAKTKKISIIFIILIFIMSTSAMLYASSQVISNPTFVSFQDNNLYSAMKNIFRAKKIAYNADDETKTIEVSIDDINTVTELDFSGNEDTKITNLAGLENFTNLETLNLSGNAIQSMSTIVGETSLPIKKLNMTGNTINEEIQTVLPNLTTLTELNMTNTQLSDVTFIANLTNLETLNLSNNNISKLETLSRLANLKKLDVSKNSSFTDFTQITSHVGLTELNVSGTGISALTYIENMGNLQKLYAFDNAGFTQTSAISSIYATYRTEIDGKNVYVPYLSELKILNLSNIGISGKRPSINFNSLSVLTTLEELHLASNEISSLSNVAKLKNLKYLDLANNKLQTSAIESLIQYDTDDNGNRYVMIEDTLRATKIDLRQNNIIDIGVFSSYPANIQYLDLSENHIYDISPLTKHSSSLETLYLQKQTITFGIYEKKVEVDQYIILPNILQQSKVPGSLVYSENNELIFDGVTLNPDYSEPLEYNVIIDSVKTKGDVLSVTLTGGNASGTVLNFQIGSKSGAHIDCLIESLLFLDENLDAAISRDLNTRYGNQIDYLRRVPHIININQDVIAKVPDFDLQHKDASENTKIKDLTGLENFYNLTKLYLQDNNLTTIQPLIGCTRLQTLNLANNANIGDNNSSIEKMPNLIELDLSNTGMTNINSINNLMNDTYISKNKDTKMTILNISGNGLNNIDGLENITSLQKLYIANENLNDEDIQILQSLTNLVTLNISGNQIENIDVVSNLINLQYLYFNKNKVRSLEPINGMVFAELQFSDNRIKDISPLYANHTMDVLEMNNNQIEDMSILSDILITEEQVLSATGQKIAKAIEEDATGNVSIELPQIFKASQESGNKLYTTYGLVLTDNCQLDSTGNNVIINVEELGDEIAQVSIYGGKANGTTLSIAPPLKPTITYNLSIETPTNQDVTATITFNRTATILNNDGKNTYTFTENGEFTFEYIDDYGFEGIATAKVENIDKVAPEGVVTQSIVEGKVVVTINVSEEISEISGWTKTTSENGKIILTKTYEEDANDTINLVDLAGNTTAVKVDVIIDETAPVINGVKEGEKYNTAVTPTVEDDSEVTVTLTKDGTVVANYQLGTSIDEPGSYQITVTDAFGNTTTVSFEIEVSDIIISTSTAITVTEDETKPLIRGITPKTTVSEMIQNLEAEMSFEILDKNGNTVSNTAKIGTGYQIKMANGKIYTLIVWGDLNGDGEISISELAAASRVASQPNTQISDIQLLAMDVSKDGNVKIPDLAVLSRLKNEG